MATKVDGEAAPAPSLGVTVATGDAAGSVLLSAPYPNPASRSADVRLMLTLEAGADVTVAVYDVLGRQVGMLAEGRLVAGAHEVLLPTSQLAGGTYLVRAVVQDAAGSRAVTQRVSVLR